MKSCPACRRLYADDAGFCPVDGLALLPAGDVPAPVDSADPRLGRVLAQRYQLRRVIADGGMGRVYEALDVQSGQRVAVKVLHDEVTGDPVALERFRREFDISRLLPHEHIVEVFDFLQLPDGTYALVMDYLEGEELRALLKREHTVSPPRLVRILSQLALGLDEAHRRQLIHRDLKPDNIYLCGTHDGDLVKLLDFGSVKDKSEGAKKLTVMGTTIGSPYYMSPEQAQGLETLDARADVWALASITFEALTGSVPFTGSNGPSILLAILTQEPKLASHVAAKNAVPIPVPAALDEVLYQAFAKNPSLRVPSVGALADLIGRAYGLTGTHRDWAYTPVQNLARAMASVLGSAPSRVHVAAEADPFAFVPHSASSAASEASSSASRVSVPPPSDSKLLLIVAASVVGLLALSAVLYLLLF